MRVPFALALAVVLSGASARAQSFTILIQEGDNVSGVGDVSFVNYVEVTDAGQWLVEVDTNNANTDIDVVVLDNSGIFLQEGQAVVVPGFPAATLDTPDSMTLNNAGRFGGNFFLAGTAGGNDDSGIFAGSTLVIQEGDDSSVVTGGTPLSPWTGFFLGHMNDLNQMLVLGSINDPAVGTSTTDRLLARITVDAAGMITASTVVALEDDVLPGMVPPARVDELDTDLSGSGFTNNGDAIFIADIDQPTNGDKILYTWIGGVYTLIAEEDTPTWFDPARDYETLLGPVALNDAGDYVYQANITGATGDDVVLIKNNNQIIAREGSTLPAIAPFLLTSPGGTSSSEVLLDSAGNVLWFGDWDDPDTSRDTGLFLNDQLILQEGDSIAGNTVIAIANGTERLAFSDNGRYVLVEVQFTGSIEAAVLIDLQGGPFPAFCFGDGGDQLGCTNCPCGNNAPIGSGGGCLNSNGLSTGAVLVPSGNPDVTTPADTLHFDVLGANVATFGILTSGDNRLPNNPANPCLAQNPGSGVLSPGILDGLRCIGGNVIRHGSRASDANGDIGITTNGWGPPNNPLTGIGVTSGFVAGQTRHFQVFYRENAAAVCMTGQNTTQGVSVTFL